MPFDPAVATGVAAKVLRCPPYDNAMIDPQLLMIRRGREDAEGLGLWSLPGGWLDRGEMIHEAAARETLEETGVRAFWHGSTLSQRHGVTTHRNHDKGLWCVTVFVSLQAGQVDEFAPAEGEVLEVSWATQRMLAQLHREERLFEPCRLAFEQGII